jgi:hypothetical protein
MKLSTGKVAFPIEFDNGDKAVIYFNPNDRGIQDRIKNFEASIDNRIKQINLDKYKERFNGGATVDVDLENPEQLLELSADELEALYRRADVLHEVEDEYNRAVREELDTVFGSKISDIVFRYCQPFDTVIVEDENGNINHEMYIMHFVRWLMVELKKYGAENKSAMEKHLSKYSK